MNIRTLRSFVDSLGAPIISQMEVSRRLEDVKTTNCSSTLQTAKKFSSVSFVINLLLRTSCETNTRTWHTSSASLALPVEKFSVRRPGCLFTIEPTVERSPMYVRTVDFPALRRTTCDCTSSSSTQALRVLKKDLPALSVQHLFSLKAT